MPKNGPGLALSDQGERTAGDEVNRILSEAVSAYRAALEDLPGMTSPRIGPCLRTAQD
jgi:hypothetical protein